jgi:hypothetical protein
MKKFRASGKKPQDERQPSAETHNTISSADINKNNWLEK